MDINRERTESPHPFARAAQAITDLKIVQQQLLTTLAETATIIAQARQVSASAKRLPLFGAGEPISPEPEATEVPRSRDEQELHLPVSQETFAPYELNPLLTGILEHVERIEHFDVASIHTVASDGVVMRAFRSANTTHTVPGIPVDLERSGAFRALLSSGQPQIVTDRTGSAEELAYLKAVYSNTRSLRTWMGVPLTAQAKVIAVLSLSHHAVGYYGSPAQARVQLFANQTALAIENAQLHQTAQQAAALAERHRLARYPHDTVRQNLFAASLTAEALLGSKNLPAKEHQIAEELYHMTRTALAEMQALSYELYPPLVQPPTKQT